MASVIDIRTVPFDSQCDESETCTVGNCSNCDGKLLEQERFGFPKVCPYCSSQLENGTDARDEWIAEIYRTWREKQQ